MGESPDGALVLARHTDEAHTTGRRDFLLFRDFKFGDASQGAFSAVDIEARRGMQQPTDWHYHVCDWQMIYMLEGWSSMEFVDREDGEPRAVRVEAGDAYLLPGGIVHRELQTSDDMHALEVVLPAKLGTVSCDPPTGGDR